MTEILCTLGPSSMNEKVIRRLEALGATLFRINLSHTDSEEMEAAIKFIQEHSPIPICLDTEGAQIRTGRLPGGEMRIQENTILDGVSSSNAGLVQGITLYPPSVLRHLEPGDLLSIDFNSVLVQVISKETERSRCGSSTAVSSVRTKPSPFTVSFLSRH